MNKSFSKIRHIQESNLRLEKRMLSEQVSTTPISGQTEQLNFEGLFTTLYNKGFNKVNFPYNGEWDVTNKLFTILSDDGKSYSFSKQLTSQPRSLGPLKFIMTLVYVPGFLLFKSMSKDKSKFDEISNNYRGLSYELKSNEYMNGQSFFNIQPDTSTNNNIFNYIFDKTGKKLSFNESQQIYINQLKPLIQF